MTSPEYDLVVIGGGPGGYVAAIRAAQLGMKVACVEKRGRLGGTCLNVGCIPSKALLQSSEKYAEATHSFAEHGIKTSGLDLDLGTMLARKDKVVDDLTKGVEFLFKKNKIEYVIGQGSIEKPGSVRVAVTGGGEKTLSTRRILIATGSEPTPLPGVTVDEKIVVSSTGALTLGKVPAHLVVVGGGYIGLEMGSVWARLGAKVTVVEFLDRIVPAMDLDLGKQFKRILEKQGLVFRLGTKVTGVETSPSGATVTVAPAAGDDGERLAADIVLVAIGRRPYTDGLGLDGVAVKRDRHGFIEIDRHFETSVKGIFAVGDVVPGPMLAHKAEEDGVAAVEAMAGIAAHVDYNLVPGIVYTWPEVAAVGRTEEQLKADGVAYKVGKFPFSANARARTTGDTDGFVKILADAKSDEVLGVHVVGPDASTIIHEAALVMAFRGSAEDIARSCHGHPTFNEAVKEAALAVDGRAVHI